MTRASRVGGQRGFALIIVLWAGLLLSVIAASFAFNMRVETRLATNLLDNSRAGAIAEAGIRRAIVALLADAPAARWIVDGRIYELPFGGGHMRIRMTSDSSGIGPNSTARPLVYTIDAVGALPGGTRASRRAMIRLTGRARDPFTIVAWYESIPES